MTSLYPLLVSAGDQVPGEPTVVGSNKACVSVSQPDSSFTFNPANYITGLQDGDYVVVIAVGNDVEFGSGVLWNDSWIHLTGPGSSGSAAVRRSAVIARFWDAGNPSDTMLIERAGSTATVCFAVYAFRGVSRRKSINSPFLSSVGSTSVAYPNSLYWPATRVSGSPTAYMVHVDFFEDPGSVSGPLAPASESNVVTGGTVRAVDHQETGRYHFYSLVVAEDRAGLQNTLGSFNELGTTTRGFTVSNMEYREQATPDDYDRYLFYAKRDQLAAKFYSGTIYANEGDTIVFTLNNQIDCPTFGTDDVVAMAITDPEGLSYGQGFKNNGVITDWNSNFDGVADAFWYNGRSGVTAVLAGIMHTTEVSGTYTLTCYAVKEGEPLVWRHQTAPTTTFSPLDVRYLAGGAALNRPPFIEASVLGAANPYNFGDYVGGTIFRIGNGVPEYAVDSAHQRMSFEVITANATHRVTQLRGEEYIKAHQFTDADRLQLAGSNQPYPIKDGTHIYSDSVVLPSYRATEEGAELPGKYYLEVEVVESTSDSDIGFGLCSNMHPMAVAYVGSPTARMGPLPLLVRGNGIVNSYNTNTAATTTTMAVNDVYGFAIDYEAAEIALYKNGNLVYTAGMDDTSVAPGAAVRTAWRFFMYIDENSATDFVPFAVNFTGPFVYSKPSGFVAWDFFAEET